MSRIRAPLLPCLVLGLALPASAPESRPISVDDLWAMDRVSRPVASPDGRHVAFVVTRFDAEANAGDADLWLVDFGSGAAPRQLTRGIGNDGAPFWRPDSRRLGFVRTLEGEPAQLYALDLGGGEPQPLATLPVAVRQARWLAGGEHIVFEAATWPGLDADFAKVRERADKAKAEATQARASESRLLRYWDHYLTDGQVPHLFELDLRDGKVRDLMPGFDRITGLEGFEWDVSADGGEIAYSANSTPAPHRELNFDIYVLDRASGRIGNITPGSAGPDTAPVYAPSGRDLLYGLGARANVGSDLTRLMRLDRGSRRALEIAPALDAARNAWQWSRDGRTAFFTVEREGRVHLYAAPAGGGAGRQLAAGGTIDAIAVGAGAVAFLRQDYTAPAQLFQLGLEHGEERPLTAFNKSQLAPLDLGKVESVRYAGHGGDTVHMWVVYPPGYRRDRRWPVLLLAHGGPFGAWNEGFSYRWNPQVFAARGYIVAMPNFHGSTGFGQRYADSILGNHGEKPAADMVAALAWLRARGDVEPRRIAIAGGSYGGYLAALLTGMTDDFAAAIVHAGVFDLGAQFASDAHWDRPSSYGSAPWIDPVELDRWSPSRLAPRFATPTLVLHGEKDYRVPVTQGINLYGVLTGKGVPARIVIFPEENHWILKPQASRLWHREFFDWLARFPERRD